MERRTALKRMGAGLGYVAATPTVLGLIQSCRSRPFEDWTPLTFTPEQGRALAKMLDVILPATDDSPGATDVGVHMFIDEYLDKVSDEQERDFTLHTMEKFFGLASEETRKKRIDYIKDADFDSLIGRFLAERTEDQEAAHGAAMRDYWSAVDAGGEADLDTEAACYSFINGLRGQAIQVYKISEEIGENVLAYYPNPGGWTPCGDLQELTGGKAYSL